MPVSSSAQSPRTCSFVARSALFHEAPDFAKWNRSSWPVLFSAASVAGPSCGPMSHLHAAHCCPSKTNVISRHLCLQSLAPPLWDRPSHHDRCKASRRCLRVPGRGLSNAHGAPRESETLLALFRPRATTPSSLRGQISSLLSPAPTTVSALVTPFNTPLITSNLVPKTTTSHHYHRQLYRLAGSTSHQTASQ